MDLKLKSGARIEAWGQPAGSKTMVLTVVTVASKYTHTWSHFEMDAAELRSLAKMLSDLADKLDEDSTR